MKRRTTILILVIILSVAGIFTIARAQIGNLPVFIPPAKATFEAQEKPILATENAVPTTVKKIATLNPNASCPSTPPAVGIFIGEGPGPFPAGDTIINQAVVKSSTGFYYELWAGAPMSDTNKGLIRIIEDDPDYCASSAKGTVFPPMRDYIYPTGPITLTKIEGDVVIFTVPGGTTARFNVITDQFLP